MNFTNLNIYTDKILGSFFKSRQIIIGLMFINIRDIMGVIETLSVSVVVRYVIAGGSHSRIKFPGDSKRCFRWDDIIPQKHTCMHKQLLFLQWHSQKNSPLVSICSGWL